MQDKKQYDKEYRLKNIEIIRAKDREYKRIFKRKQSRKSKRKQIENLTTKINIKKKI